MEFSMSKGSNPRPIPNRKQFEENWDKIFKKKGKTFLKKRNWGLDILDSLLYSRKD